MTNKKAAKADSKKSTAPAPAPTQPPARAQETAAAAPPAPEHEQDKQFVAPSTGTPTPQAETATSVHRLERAQALPELAKADKSKLVAEGIQSFKDADRRTMNVVIAGGALHKQEV